MISSDRPMTTEITPPSLALLNPEAGAHPIPEDPRELAAAVVSGERGLARYPYLLERFGERGRSFTKSDSAWLVTLTSLPQSIVDDQIRWLGALLGLRGIPRIILEVHLRFLHKELCAVNPAIKERYDRLLVAADMLKERRLRGITAEDFARLAARFDEAMATAEPPRLAHMGEILISAASDERDGIVGALSVVTSWLADPLRFTSPVIAMAKKIGAEALQLMAAGESKAL